MAVKCLICKGRTGGNNKKYCHTCAYVKGICEMCGKKILDVSMYKQSDVDKVRKKKVLVPIIPTVTQQVKTEVKIDSNITKPDNK